MLRPLMEQAMSRFALAALMGLAVGLGQNGPPPSFGALQRVEGFGGSPGYTKTKRGGQMQRFNVKKPRNRKGQSR